MTDDHTPITTADIKFPQKDGGLHTYHIGDKVTFADKYQRVHTGSIDRFELYQGKIWCVALSDRYEGSGVLVLLSKVLPAEWPRAIAMTAPHAHLECGTVVRVTLGEGKSYGGVADGDLAVVLADKGLKVNVAKLGGAGDCYVRLSHDRLIVIPLDELAAALPRRVMFAGSGMDDQALRDNGIRG